VRKSAEAKLDNDDDDDSPFSPMIRLKTTELNQRADSILTAKSIA
jgi:hypothetical protein